MSWRVQGMLDDDRDLAPGPLAGRVLRLDLDHARLPARIYQQVVGACRRLRVGVVLFLARRTERGWHVKVQLTRRLAPAHVVAVQAILGSDGRRELFNLKRVRALRRVPAEQRGRYSVLFLRRFRLEQTTMPRKIVTPEGGFKRLPSIRPEDLGGADVTVVTVSEVQDNIPVTKPDGRKKFSMRLRFEEYPERNFWPNATSQGWLKKKLGPDTRGWVGCKVVLEVVESETPDGEPALTVWVAEPVTWPEHMRAFAAAAAAAAPTA